MARYISTPTIQSGFRNRCVYSTPGAYTFTVPDGVTSIKAIAVGGGAPGSTGFVEDYTEFTRTIEIPPYQSCCNCGCFNTYVSRCYGNVSTQFGVCFTLEAQLPFFKKYAYAYTGAGGGYAEKDISVNPGDSFCVIVGDQEETSSFGSEISATGAGAPTAVRASKPCCYGWERVTISSSCCSGISINPGDRFCSNLDPQSVGICPSELARCCGGDGAAACWSWRNYWCVPVGIDEQRIGYRFKKTVDCPVVSLTSTPGCGVGGDINYTGGPSKTYSTQVAGSEIVQYGKDLYFSNNAFCVNRPSTYCLQMSASMYGCQPHNCCSNSWDRVINCLIPGSLGCYGTSSPYYRGHTNFDFSHNINMQQFAAWCCCRYTVGFPWPYNFEFSSDKQFLSANQGGASSGSPLGNGQTGGIGQTLFTNETESPSYSLSGFMHCGNSGCCRATIRDYFCNNYVFCDEACGYTNSSLFTTCPLLMFPQYEYGYIFDDTIDMEQTFAKINLAPGSGVLSPRLTGACAAAGECDCIFIRQCANCCFYGAGWKRDCSPACNDLCNTLANFVIRSCVSCCGCMSSSCLGSPWALTSLANNPGAHYNCRVEGRQIWHKSYDNDSSCNCCCGYCYENASLCLLQDGCLLKPNTTLDEIIDEYTKNTPWVKDVLCKFDEEICNPDGRLAQCHSNQTSLVPFSCWQKALTIQKCMFQSSLNRTFGVNRGGCSGDFGGYSTYCNCHAGRYGYISVNYQDNSYYTVCGCDGFDPSNINICCNNAVKTKALSVVNPAEATIIPGSAGGPGSQGNPGYILGENEVLIAGHGADPYGVTPPQYILTSSASAMPKATYDLIRNKYSCNLYFWWLNECWQYICPKFASGGIASCNGCVCSLENFTCHCLHKQYYIANSHATAGNGCCVTIDQCGSDSLQYGIKSYTCMWAELQRKFNLHNETIQGEWCGGCCSGFGSCIVPTIDIGSSGGIVISSKSKGFVGDPLCINTAGDSTVTSVQILDCNHFRGEYCCLGILRYMRCPSCRPHLNCEAFTGNFDYLTSCINNDTNCKIHFSGVSLDDTCGLHFPHPNFGACMTSGISNSPVETDRQSGSTGSGVFINEQYSGEKLNDEYLFSSSDPVFGGSGQICVFGSSLYSLPGLTQGGSAGGYIVKGNQTQPAEQTAYSGGIFPKGKPGFGGGGTICGQGGTGLVVVYWN